MNGVLKENVFMMLPEGLEYSNCRNKALKLKKAIYGVKQSSRAWYQKVDDLLNSLGFKKSDLEPCFFTKIQGNAITIIALYVDDFFIFPIRNSRIEV